jgi:Arc/MetJ-type ribon-helix-helix transcriptional regulator
MTTKIAISLPDELVAAARQAVAAGRATSVSAFVADAIREHGRYEGLAELLAEMATATGAPTQADRAWARRALGIPSER